MMMMMMTTEAFWCLELFSTKNSVNGDVTYFMWTTDIMYLCFGTWLVHSCQMVWTCAQNKRGPNGESAFFPSVSGLKYFPLI